MPDTVQRNDLLSSVKAVEPATTDKEVVQQSDCFAFSDGFVWSYDDEIAISSPVNTEIEGSVSAKELIALLSKIKADEIELEANDNEVTISWGKKKTASFRVEDVKLPLDEIEVPVEDDWIDLPEDFCECVQFVLFSVGKDLSKPVLTCVHIEGNIAESADDTRFSRRVMKGNVDNELFIPAKAAQVMIQYEPEAYSIRQGWLYFINKDDVVVCCRTFGENYPDLTRFVPSADQGTTINLPVEMRDVLDRAGVFSSRKVKQDEMVTCKVANNELTVTAESDTGKIVEVIDIDYKGDAVSFMANPSFLSDALKLAHSAIVTDNLICLDCDTFTHGVSLFVEA